MTMELDPGWPPPCRRSCEVPAWAADNARRVRSEGAKCCSGAAIPTDTASSEADWSSTTLWPMAWANRSPSTWGGIPLAMGENSTASRVGAHRADPVPDRTVFWTWRRANRATAGRVPEPQVPGPATRTLMHATVRVARPSALSIGTISTSFNMLPPRTVGCLCAPWDLRRGPTHVTPTLLARPLFATVPHHL